MEALRKATLIKSFAFSGIAESACSEELAVLRFQDCDRSDFSSAMKHGLFDDCRAHSGYHDFDVACTWFVWR